jgi:hypothetical protein
VRQQILLTKHQTFCYHTVPGEAVLRSCWFVQCQLAECAVLCFRSYQLMTPASAQRVVVPFCSQPVALFHIVYQQPTTAWLPSAAGCDCR